MQTPKSKSAPRTLSRASLRSARLNARGNTTRQGFDAPSLSPTGTLSRRHLAHFVSAVDTEGDPRTAVCVQCDTKVMLTDIPVALQTAFRVGATVETTFAQRESGLYRDGLRLPDGRFVSLQDLQPGIGAYVPALLERQGSRRLRMPEAVD